MCGSWLLFLVSLPRLLAFRFPVCPPRQSPINRYANYQRINQPILSTSTTLFSSTKPGTVSSERRREMLSRNGPHFQIKTDTIEFGASAQLVTILEEEGPNQVLIEKWLRDGDSGLAQSIWDPDLITRLDKSTSVYRLEMMTLQFVTLQLSPWVDVEMKTISDSQGNPVFVLQSLRCEPNVQVLPGMKIDADALGIIIEVVGQLRPSKDGRGVSGTISFQTSGGLPPPLRILPTQVLKAASDTINQTIVNFAIQSFEKGAKQKYDEFKKSR